MASLGCTCSTSTLHLCRCLWHASPAESSSVQQLLESFGSGHTVRLDVADSSKPATAGSMLQATSDIASANPDLAVKVLDHSALKVRCLT